LPLLQKIFPSYDTYFGEIFQKLEAIYPGATVIDVGANVGDTTLGILANAPSFHCVAVEGNELFLKYRYHNLDSFRQNVTTVPKFLHCSKVGDFGYVDNGSTGRFHSIGPHEISNNGNKIRVKDLLEMHPSHLTIWKSDTDGSDVPIVIENLELLDSKAGIWWLELDASLPATDKSDIANLLHSTQIGDRKFLLFDNYGRLVMHGILSNYQDAILKLFDLLAFKNRRINSVNYYDIMLFDTKRFPILEEVISSVSKS